MQRHGSTCSWYPLGKESNDHLGNIDIVNIAFIVLRFKFEHKTKGLDFSRSELEVHDGNHCVKRHFSGMCGGRNLNPSPFYIDHLLFREMMKVALKKLLIKHKVGVYFDVSKVHSHLNLHY